MIVTGEIVYFDKKKKPLKYNTDKTVFVKLQIWRAEKKLDSDGDYYWQNLEIVKESALITYTPEHENIHHFIDFGGLTWAYSAKTNGLTVFNNYFNV